MKNFKIFLSLFTILVWSCSSDDSGGGSSNNITVNGTNYPITNGTAIVQINEGSDGISRTLVTLTGGITSGTTIKTGRASFYVYYTTSEGISRSYTVTDSEELNHYSNTLSTYLISETVSGNTQIDEGDSPSGNFSITDNGDDNYSVSFNVTYEDGTTASASYTGNFLVQYL